MAFPKSYHDQFYKQPLEQRPWAFQERVACIPGVKLRPGRDVFWSCAHIPFASEMIPHGDGEFRHYPDLLN